MRKCIGQALILLLGSMGLGLLGNAMSPRGLPLRSLPPNSLNEGEFLSLDRAKELWNNGTAIFLDAREPAEYSAGHIGSAFNLPAFGFEAHFGDVAPVLAPHSQIVVYCDGTECDLSHRVGERLRQMGFTNVRILSNGWTVWRQAGLPVQRSTK